MTSGNQTSAPQRGAAGRERLAGRDRMTVAAVAATGLTAFGVSIALGPGAVGRGPVLCPFLRMTGLPCPACGLTRSWVALGHGDVPSAFGFNAFGPLSMLVLAVVTVVAIWALITGRPVLGRVQRALTSPVALAVLVAWLGYGIVRALDAGFGWGVFATIT